MARSGQATWNDDRNRWLYPCGHVAVSRSGKPLRRSATPARECRACREIAAKAQRELEEKRRLAELATRGLAETVVWCPSCGSPRAVSHALGEQPERGECPGCVERRVWRAWLAGARRAVQAALRKRGWRCVRRARPSSGSSYYEHPDRRETIRLSDHALPVTPEREYNHSQGWRCADLEILLDHRCELASLLADVAEMLDD